MTAEFLGSQKNTEEHDLEPTGNGYAPVPPTSEKWHVLELSSTGHPLAQHRWAALHLCKLQEA